jgi:hypothetical protein
VLGGRKYRYFYHYYNTTWYNERAVEIPVITEIVRENLSRETLEVGNVLGHYFRFEHHIVDKYENKRGITNKDILDFEPTKKYDLIVSISTLEHIGWDETPRDETKTFLAIAKLKTLLSSSGMLIVTLPLGYNQALDKMLKKSMIQFNKLYCLRRISKCNKWIETRFESLHNIEYNSPFPGANALLIGIITNNQNISF